MTETLDLTRALIARPSVSPDDGGCQELMIERLAPLGFADRAHALRQRRRTCGPRAAAATGRCSASPGHTDVVPTGPLEEWHSDPFDPVVRDGFLYGRGAADMKSGLAAMVTADRGVRARRAGACRHHRVPDHQRRGGPVGGRHAPGRRGAAGARPAHRPVPGRRAVQRPGVRRHGQDRPARLAVRPADRARRAGPHRLPAAGREPGARDRAGARRAGGAQVGRAAASTSSPRPSRSRISRPAPARRT